MAKFGRYGIKPYEMNKRYRSYEGTRSYSYDTDEQNESDTKNMSEDEWKAFIVNEYSNIKINENDEIWFIFHDKDTEEVEMTDDEGAVLYDENNNVKMERVTKALHCHFTVFYENARRPNAVLKAFGVNASQMSVLNSKAGQMRYMTHTSIGAMNEKKNRYEIKELYLIRGKSINTDNEEETIVINERVPYDEMFEIYTEYISEGKRKTKDSEKAREFSLELNAQISEGFLNFNKRNEYFKEEFGVKKGQHYYAKNEQEAKIAYESFKEKYIYEMRKPGNRNLVTVYINGPSDVGKTHFAKELLRIENYENGFPENEVFNISGNGKNLTSDPFDKYMMQYSTLMDEVMPDKMWTFSQFNLDFDRESVPTVASRHTAKDWLSQVCAIVKSRPIERVINGFVNNVLMYSDEDDSGTSIENIKFQIMKRIPISIVLERNSVELKSFNRNTGVYDLVHYDEFDVFENHEKLFEFTMIVHEEIKRQRELPLNTSGKGAPDLLGEWKKRKAIKEKIDL